MERKLYSVNEVIHFISEGRKMVLSGDESVLDKLPAGNWIGGTSPYFMDKTKGVFSTENIFVDDFSELGLDFKIIEYNKNTMESIVKDSFRNGFTILILPGDSEAHFEFSIHSLDYDGIFDNPIVGFVAGFDLNKIGIAKPKVYLGTSTKKIEQNGVALHVQLPSNRVARAEILNLDTIDPQSPSIKFPSTSFTQSECLIDGKKSNIADYLTDINYKAGLPIMANYNGAMINRDIKVIDKEKREVSFFSPVFSDETYFLAKVIDNYHDLFNQKLDLKGMNIPYSCICVSYYGLGNLENKKIGAEGVFAFGEIAFTLLNQTLVYLEIDHI